MIEDVASTSILVTIAVSEDQEAIEIPEAMVIEKKLLELLSLLESHAGDATPEIPVVPRSLTLVPPPPTQTELVDKKRKWDKKGGKGSAKEREIQEETPPKQAKVAKVTRSQQRRGGETSKMVLEHRPHVYNWNTLILDGAPFPADSSIRIFYCGRAGYVANLVEQALLLPWDMAKLRNFKKHKMLLSLKRDLALVCSPSSFIHL